MPRKTLVIGDFKGGLNNVKSEKDIDVSESPQIFNANNEDEGRLKLTGSAKDNYLSFNDSMTVSTAGSGFFSFSHDYTMVCPTGGGQADDSGGAVPGRLLKVPLATSTDYLVKENGGDISIYDYTNSEWLGTSYDVDMGAAGGSSDWDVEYLFVEGALRITDRNKPSGKVKFIGHIRRDLFQTSAGAVGLALNKWWIGDANILPWVVSTTTSNSNNHNTDFSRAGYVSANDVGNLTYNNFGTWNTLAITDNVFDREGLCFHFSWVDDSGDGGEGSSWSSLYKYIFYATALYDDGNQESEYEPLMTTGSAPPSLTCSLICAVNVKVFQQGTTVSGNQNSMTNISDRVSGARIYVGRAGDGYGEKNLLLDIDFEKGIRKAESSVVEAWSAIYAPNTLNNAFICPATAFDDTIELGKDVFFFQDPPTAGTFAAENGHEAMDSINASFKASCILGDRAFIGNIYQDGTQHGDRILYSPSRQYDKYPSMNKWDITINDGEAIVTLLSFGSRILVFKESTLYIVDIAEDLSPSSTKHPFKGIERHYQVCKTPTGLYWVNKYGLFWYDGENIINLMEGKLKRVQGTLPYDNAWTWGSYESIGYDEDTHKLIILRDVRASKTNSGNAWMYDIRLNSWMFAKNLVDSGAKKTNWSNTPDGNLVYSVTGANTVSTIPTAASSATVSYTFKLNVVQTGSEDDPFVDKMTEV